MILEDFLKLYNISNEEFSKTGLDWNNLLKIKEDYLEYKKKLEDPAIYYFNILMTIPKVHYVRYRVKNEEHVIEKIIRKKIEEPTSKEITIENYKHMLTDLMGVRAIHLYKSDWTEIDAFIKSQFKLKRKPIAYLREGDDKEVFVKYRELGCIPKIHKQAYRSVHYIISPKKFKLKSCIEIQVRTIFEEAWSEIDHKIRYPYYKKNKIFSEFFLVFNRLVGAADEMGTFIKNLHADFKDSEQKNSTINSKENKNEEELTEEIKNKIMRIFFDNPEK